MVLSVADCLFLSIDDVAIIIDYQKIPDFI